MTLNGASGQALNRLNQVSIFAFSKRMSNPIPMKRKADQRSNVNPIENRIVPIAPKTIPKPNTKSTDFKSQKSKSSIKEKQPLLGLQLQ
jgi:hypothetical protein